MLELGREVEGKWVGGKEKKNNRKEESKKEGRFLSRHFLLSSSGHLSRASSFLQQKLFCKASPRFFHLTAATRAYRTWAESRVRSRWPARVTEHLPTGILEVASRLSPRRSSLYPEGTGTLQSPACTPRGVQTSAGPGTVSQVPHSLPDGASMSRSALTGATQSAPRASHGAAVSDHCVSILGVT